MANKICVHQTIFMAIKWLKDSRFQMPQVQFPLCVLMFWKGAESLYGGKFPVGTTLSSLVEWRRRSGWLFLSFNWKFPETGRACTYRLLFICCAQYTFIVLCTANVIIVNCYILFTYTNLYFKQCKKRKKIIGAFWRVQYTFLLLCKR